MNQDIDIVSPDPYEKISRRDWEKQLAIYRQCIRGVGQLVCTHGFSQGLALAAWQQAKEEKGKKPTQMNLARCILMGAEERAARAALEKTEDNLERALQYLMQ